MESRVGVVTGGAGGLGNACAERLAREGLAIALVDLDQEAVTEAAARLPRRHATHVGLSANVTSRSSVASALSHVRSRLGPISVLLNGAGIVRTTRVLSIEESEWDAVVNVSLKGTFLFSQACLPDMIANRHGRIVNFSSSAGKSVSTIGGAHYTAAKAGLLGLTRAMAKEVAPFGVTVNAICPGLFDTAMVRANTTSEERARFAASFPVPRLGEPAEIAALVSYLCSDEAGYVTGAAVDINGGDLMV